MRASAWPAAAVVAFGLAAAAACTPAPTAPLPGPPVPFADAATLVDYLREAGVSLEELGTAQYAWFAAQAATYQVGSSSSDVLYVHEFADATAAADAARHVSPDGLRIVSPTNQEIVVQWLGQPHLYQNGRLLVVYVGTDLAMLDRLTEAMGPQFAGTATGQKTPEGTAAGETTPQGTAAGEITPQGTPPGQTAPEGTATR